CHAAGAITAATLVENAGGVHRAIDRADRASIKIVRAGDKQACGGDIVQATALVKDTAAQAPNALGWSADGPRAAQIVFTDRTGKCADVQETPDGLLPAAVDDNS